MEGQVEQVFTLCLQISSNLCLLSTFFQSHGAQKEHVHSPSFTALATALAEASQDIGSFPNFKEE